VASQPHETKAAPAPGRVEFIVLMAAMTALDAFSIDGMLPALENMATDLHLAVDNHRQYVVTAIFFGFSIGVLIYGFLSDQYGRRGPVVLGFGVFFLGSLLCIFANTFTMLLVGRVLQGLGAAGPYVLATAIVRDLYKGRDMAQIMSLISAVFIGVPLVAPFIGQGVMLLAGWRAFFIVLALYAVLVLMWFWVRQPETLLPQHRQVLSIDTPTISTLSIGNERKLGCFYCVPEYGAAKLSGYLQFWTLVSVDVCIHCQCIWYWLCTECALGTLCG